MNTFNVLADFIAKDGLVIMAGSYSETIKGCGVTASVFAMSPNLSEKECYRYTFWLLRMPICGGSCDIRIVCFKRERVVAKITRTICPYCGVSKIWISTFA